MSDAVRRAIRTFVQAFTGSILTNGVLSAMATNGVVDWTLLEKAGVSALVAAVIALLTFLQNWAEDRGTIPSILKASASDGANPITNDPPVV